MAKVIKSGYTLICPGCETQKQSPFKAAICTVCGQTAVMPPLTDGAFEKAADGDDMKATKPEKKPAEDTSNRPADDGGRTF
jgi:hypothetical protein